MALNRHRTSSPSSQLDSSSVSLKSLLQHITHSEPGHHRNLKFDVMATLATRVVGLQYYTYIVTLWACTGTIAMLVVKMVDFLMILSMRKLSLVSYDAYVYLCEGYLNFQR